MDPNATLATLHEEVSETYQISSPGKTNTFKYQYSDADKLGTGYADDSYRDWETDRKSTRLNSSHSAKSRMPSSA